jgi:hypothetical protein
MTVMRFLREGGLFYTVGLTAKWVYRKIRWCFPEGRLNIRRAPRMKSKSNCIWKPASSK